jgi:hypothetical protein
MTRNKMLEFKRSNFITLERSIIDKRAPAEISLTAFLACNGLH